MAKGGRYVSKEQPSIADDPRLTDAFYGAPTVCVVFGPENFLYSVADDFCCAENMVLAAYELGISSCCIARAEETFESPWAPISWRSGASPATTRPGALWLWAMWKGTTRRKSPGKTAG